MEKKFTLWTLLIIAISCISFIQTDAQGKIVISQVYGGGGNSGTTLKNDFIELFNNGNAPVNVTGWSVQYASSSGTSWAVTPLSGTIPAGGYYLIQQAAGSGGTTNLPTPNSTGSIAMSATAGKVALVNSTTPLTGTGCPFATSVIDFVGYGGANCFETAAVAALSNTTAAIRKNNGCTDAGNNSTDFSILAPAPRNSSSAINLCGVVSQTIAIGSTTNAAEPSASGSFTFTFSPATSASTFFDYILSGSAIFNSDYTVSLNLGASPSPLTSISGTITVPQGVSTLTISIIPKDDFITEGNETITINISAPSGGYSVVPASATETISLGDDDLATTFIHTIQGSGSNATTGNYAIEGIVTAVYPNWSPAGFFVQEEDADADNDLNTSEGIYVVQNNPTVTIGNKVRVTGFVQENGSSPSFGQAVIIGASITIIATAERLPTPVLFSLPVSIQSDLEKYEGMLVHYAGTLTVSDNSELGNRGSLALSAGGVVYQPTQVVDPNDADPSATNTSGASNIAAVNAYNTSNINRTIILDDGSNSALTSLSYVNAENTNRIGSTTTNLTGIMGYGFSAYRIQPVSYAVPTFAFAPRPELVVYPGNLKFASFNVLNYFNGNGEGGGYPTSRGADSETEFNRQRTKIISAISEIDADIVGLLELENDGTGPTSAIQNLVNGLNELKGAGTYAFINDGATVQTFNTDEIRSGIIYKPGKVTPVGGVMTSASLIFERPPLAQNFKLNGVSMEFNYIINHFKSKGGCPRTGDIDLGQGCFNERRKHQATELLNFINTVVIPVSGNARILSMGDYNAYYEEDPMDLFRTDGYTVLGSATSFSYLFGGQLGSLDHAVVSPSMYSLLTGFSKWNINSVEPSYLDYNDGIRDASESTSEVNPWAGTYTVSPFRSSDHDALVAYFFIPKSTDLLITKSATTTVTSGGLLTYTITALNNGPDEAESLVITDVLPAGTSFHSLSAPSGWITTTPATGQMGTITATLPTLESGTSQTFILVVKTSCGIVNNTILNNTASITGTTPDPNSDNNAATASTTVIASNLSVSVPDATALDMGVLPNTVYIGYTPASTITLNAIVSGGTSPITYSWTDGTKTWSSSSITVSPLIPTTYTVIITDANGCQATAFKMINVFDVRGGKQNDKVIICHKPSKQANTLVVGHEAVAEHLAHGDMLSSCNNVDPSITLISKEVPNSLLDKVLIQAMPNPSTNYFTIKIEGLSDQEKTSLKVADLLGRLMEQNESISNNSVLTIGHNYQPGIYIVELSQGLRRKQLKLIKSSN